MLFPATHCFLSLLALAGGALAQEPQQAPRNILLIISDDHGRDTGAYGNTDVQTPHLDALAAQGSRFTHAFATTASCSASRSVLLTGWHNHRTGQFGHAHDFHHFESYDHLRSLPQLLSEAGYHTARVGKFHLAPEAAYPFETVISASSRSPVEMAERCREVFTGKKEGEAADPRPFFLFYATSDPHRGSKPSGFTTRIDESDNFGNRPKRGYPGVTTVQYAAEDLSVPAWLPDTAVTRAELAQYYQSVSRLDQGVGRLLALLDESGRAADTLVLYLSDHGAAFAGAKTTVYEPGLRVPLIVRKPGARAGAVSSAMISWVDITPTLLDWAGVPKPEWSGAERAPLRRGVKNEGLHGRSFLAIIDADEVEGWDEVYASHTFHEITMYYPMRVLRESRYKLIWNLAHGLPYPFATDLWISSTWQQSLQAGLQASYGPRTVEAYLHRPKYELYDVQADPWESTNLASDPKHAATLQRMIKKLHRFQAQTQDPWRMKQDYE